MKYAKIGLIIVFVLVLTGFFNGMSSSALAAGPAFSGITASADTAETVYLNPSGMTRLKRPSFYVSSMILYTESSTEITAEGVEGKQKLEDDSVYFLPGLYYSRPLSDRWYVGIGPNAASGFGTTYGDNWPGRYILDEWSMYFIGIVPSVAYRVNNKLSLGASASVNYTGYNLKKAVFNGPGASDGNFELEANGWAVGGVFGLLYEFTPQTRFGIVYRSELEASNEGNPDFSDLTPERRALLDQMGILDQKISVDTNQPQSLIAGIFHDFGNGWSISFDAMWLDFSNWNIDNITIGDTEINRDSTDYQDIWGSSLGVTYAWKPDWTFRGGFLYLSSGVEDENRTLFTRLDAMWALGFGVDHQFNERRFLKSLAVDITYFQFGDGEFKINDAPLVGDIEGEYDKNFGLALSISITL